MSGATALGTLALITGGLGALIVYAHRAGKNAENVGSKRDALQDATKVLKRLEGALTAETRKPADQAALVQRLDAGNA